MKEHAQLIIIICQKSCIFAQLNLRKQLKKQITTYYEKISFLAAKLNGISCFGTKRMGAKAYAA